MFTIGHVTFIHCQSRTMDVVSHCSGGNVMSCCLCPAVLYVNHVQNPNVCSIITCSSHHIKVLYGLVTNSLHDVSSLHCISFLLQAYVLHATKINNEPIQQHLSLMSQLSLLALAVIFLATRPQVYEHSHAISQIISAWSNKMTDMYHFTC